MVDVRKQKGTVIHQRTRNLSNSVATTPITCKVKQQRKMGIHLFPKFPFGVASCSSPKVGENFKAWWMSVGTHGWPCARDDERAEHSCRVERKRHTSPRDKGETHGGHVRPFKNQTREKKSGGEGREREREQRLSSRTANTAFHGRTIPAWLSFAFTVDSRKASDACDRKYVISRTDGFLNRSSRSAPFHGSFAITVARQNEFTRRCERKNEEP